MFVARAKTTGSNLRKLCSNSVILLHFIPEFRYKLEPTQIEARSTAISLYVSMFETYKQS